MWRTILSWFRPRAKYRLEYASRNHDRPGLVFQKAGIGRSADYGAALRSSIRNAGLKDYNEY